MQYKAKQPTASIVILHGGEIKKLLICDRKDFGDFADDLSCPPINYFQGICNCFTFETISNLCGCVRMQANKSKDATQRPHLATFYAVSLPSFQNRKYKRHERPALKHCFANFLLPAILRCTENCEKNQQHFTIVVVIVVIVVIIIISLCATTHAYVFQSFKRIRFLKLNANSSRWKFVKVII
uniref:Uncharacterized protein n=1 Tax=Glossina pallidipes TaxID=7398 RepID=A0A1A9ZIY1_GLOPL